MATAQGRPAATGKATLSKARAEWRAREAYRRSVGAQFRPYAVHGYKDGDRDAVLTHGTVVVVVLGGASNSGDICRDMEGECGSMWTDSYYPVDIIEDPNGLLAGYGGLEVDGPTFNYTDDA